jgi:hypoxanthine phosphoribosyltransferase
VRVLIPAAELSRRVAELAAMIDADYRRVGGGSPGGGADPAGGPGTGSADTGADPGAGSPGAEGPDTVSSAARPQGGGVSGGEGPARESPGGEPRPASDPLIAVGVLKGSVFFLADLLKHISVPVAVDFFQTSSYGRGGANRGEVRIRKDLDLSIQGRDVLLVEDIVDTGYTVRTILDLLRFRGARSVRLCALLDKAAARQIEVPIDYRGFAIENVFVVGYGLDFDERCRNLPYIAVWQPESAAPPSERRVSGMRFHHTDQAPAAIGPYSQAVAVDGWLYTSGQVGLDPKTGELVAGGFEAQARRALENLRQVLASAGCGFADVVKATVFVVDLADFPRLNALYGEAMGEHRPARSTVQVAALPRGALVEIDLVARLPEGSR